MNKLLELLALIIILMFLSSVAADTTPMKPGDVFSPHVIDNARDMIHLYPSADTIILPELSRDEEQEIVDLIQDKNRTYVAIKRNVSVDIDNWEFVGSKKSSDIWQLHIKSPGAIAIQTFFYEATLFPELDIKIYSGEEGMTSHIGEHKGNNSGNAENFWSTKVPGNIIVIEVWVPQSRNLAPANFPFEIKYINHYFRENSEDVPILKYFSIGTPQQNNQCSVLNSLCDFGNNIKVWSAISLLEYTEPSGRVGQCTGTFLNNGQSDGELFLLTAFHCIYPGSSQNMVKGSNIDAQILTSISPCSSAADRLVGNEIRFIAGNEKADWALLWVNRATLSRADGLNLSANGPSLLGSSIGRLAVGSDIETLHHARGTAQNYARAEVTRYIYAEGQAGTEEGLTNFASCQNPAGCTHYEANAMQGGVLSGASGSSWWSPRFMVRGAFTHSSPTSTCDVKISLFDKMYEDGRVRCALNEGRAYYPNNTSTCDDSSRASYSNDSGSSGSSGGGGGGGGGSTGLWFVSFLIFSSLACNKYSKKTKPSEKNKKPLRLSRL